MFYNKVLEAYNIEQLEYCYNLDEPSNTSTIIKGNIPKLMPLISRGDPNTNKSSIDSSIFVNDPSGCKLTIPTILSTQNYITIQGYTNIDLTHLYKSPTDSRIPKGTQLICEIMSGNITKIRLTDKI